MTTGPMAEPAWRLAARPDAADDDPTLDELMSTRMVAIVQEATTMVALRLMATTGVRHLPVMAGRRCLGVVAEIDLLHALGDPGGDADPVRTRTRRVPVLQPGDRRSAAAAGMASAGTDAVVVSDGERLVGLVTATDVLRSVAEQTGADR